MTLSDHIRPAETVADLFDAPGCVRLPAMPTPIPRDEEADWDDWAAIGERGLWRQRNRARHRHARAYVRHQAERAMARGQGRARYLLRGIMYAQYEWIKPKVVAQWERHLARALARDRVVCSCWMCQGWKDYALPVQALRLRDADAADLEALCEAPEPDALVEYMADYGGDQGLSTSDLRGMALQAEADLEWVPIGDTTREDEYLRMVEEGERDLWEMMDAFRVPSDLLGLTPNHPAEPES